MEKLDNGLTTKEKAIVALKNWSYPRRWDIYLLREVTEWPGGFYSVWSNVLTPDGYRTVAFHFNELGEVTPFVMGEHYEQN